MPTVSAGRVCDAPACRVAYRRHLQFGGKTCLVCGVPLPGSVLQHATTCGQLKCHVQFLRQKDLPAEQRCRVCRVPLPSHRLSVGVCTDRECDAIDAGHRLAETARREKERLVRLRGIGEAKKSAEAEAAGIQHPEDFAVVVVPHTEKPLVRREEVRVARVRERLESIVRWAFTHKPDDSELPRRPGWRSDGVSESSIYQPDDIAEEATELESTLFAAGCGLCRGMCCRQGADHAFLNIVQIRRFLAEHPELTEEETVEAYIAFIPELSIEDSCIYHGERGCTLPREMRSDMCNRWLCAGLKEIRETVKAGTSPKFYLIADKADQQYDRTTFVESC